MSAIQIKELPANVADRITRLAHETGSAVEEEALRCLERGVSEREQAAAELADIRRFRESAPNVWLTDEMLRAAKEEGRP